MARPQRKTFQQILAEEASRSAQELETKAREASWLAKIEPTQSRALYSIKHAALRHLFRIPGHAPFIREAWGTNAGFLLSVRLRWTGGLLHMPFDELYVVTQQSQAPRVARLAQRKWWRKRREVRRHTAQKPHPCGFGRRHG